MLARTLKPVYVAGMLVYFDREQHDRVQQAGRYHPWTVTLNTPDGRYIDFKSDPEAIQTGLEDLAHIRGTPLEAAFVDFFRWANGDGSAFETNDFGLRPLRDNISSTSKKSLEQACRLTVLFRDLRRNTIGGDLIPFAQRMERALHRTAPEFNQACWGWSLWPHLFTALGSVNDPHAYGNVIQYHAWAWGDTADEAHDNMIRALLVLRQSLESTLSGD